MLHFMSAAALSLAILTLWMSEPDLALILSRAWFCLVSAVSMSLAMFLMLPTIALTCNHSQKLVVGGMSVVCIM